jgi:hypothetical protein
VKRLGLLHELKPHATHFAMLVNPRGDGAERLTKELINREGTKSGGPTDAARHRRRGHRMTEGARQSWRDQPVQVRPRQGLASRLEASVA